MELREPDAASGLGAGSKRLPELGLPTLRLESPSALAAGSHRLRPGDESLAGGGCRVGCHECCVVDADDADAMDGAREPAGELELEGAALLLRLAP